MSPNIPPSYLETYPWKAEDQTIWFASSLELKRNLGRYCFPSKLQKQESDQVLEALRGALTSISSIKGPHFVKQNELSPHEREMIYEHFLFVHGLRELPDGSGFLLSEDGRFLAMLNMSNHLELHALTVDTPWEDTWNFLSRIETEVGNREGFAFSPKFGYLTADPAQCGTGLIGTAYLHLPALIHSNQLESALANAEDEDIVFSGLSGDLFEMVGDVVLIQNSFTLGTREETILHGIQNAATKLIGAEKTMRNHLKEEESSEIKDLTSKAFGLLVHSFQLETKEALDLLSMMKLGLYLGYVDHVKDRKLSELFFQCRRGHLSHLFSDIQDPKELEKKRAEFLQSELSGISLTSEE